MRTIYKQKKIYKIGQQQNEDSESSVSSNLSDNSIKVEKTKINNPPEKHINDRCFDLLDEAIKQPFAIHKHLDILIDKIACRKIKKEKKRQLEQELFINPDLFVKKKTTKKVSFFDESNPPLNSKLTIIKDMVEED